MKKKKKILKNDNYIKKELKLNEFISGGKGGKGCI
jgi:hypothetical protein